MKQALSFLFCSLLLFVCSLSTAWGRALPSARGEKGKKPFTIVIDAGHGGKDAGAVGLISKEKDINLKVALAFGRLIETNLPQVRVIYTRTTDTFVTLQGRADIANRAKADLFVSVHTNSVASNKNKVSGAETYTLGMHRAAENLEVAKRENSVITQEVGYQKTYKNFDPRKSESYIIFEFMQDLHMQQSVSLARHIQKEYTQRGRKNKGVHQAGFLVLRATSMPSVLTELGFISHPEEERFMNSREGIETLSRSLYESFRAYRRQYAHADEPEETTDAPLLAQAETDNRSPEAPTLPNAYQPNEREVLRVVMADDEAMNQKIRAEVVPLAILPYPKGQPAQAPRASMTEQPSVAQISMSKAEQEAHRAEAQAQTAARAKAEEEARKAEAQAQTAARAKAEEEARRAEAQAQAAARAKAEEEARKAEAQAQAAARAKAEEEARRAEAQAQAAARAKAEEEARKAEEQAQAAARAKAEEERKAKALALTAAAKREDTTKETATEKPIFKLQLLTSERLLQENDVLFQNVAPIEYYQEGGRYKYTTGASTDLKTIKQLRENLVSKFPQAFVIALLKGQRIDLKTAIEMSRNLGNTKHSPRP